MVLINKLACSYPFLLNNRYECWSNADAASIMQQGTLIWCAEHALFTNVLGHNPVIFVSLCPAFHCGGNARGNARVIKRTRPVPDSCVSMEAFSARVSAPVFDDLCVHLDLPRVYKCEMVSFQLMLTKNRARFTFTSGNSDIVSKFFSACGNA